MARITKVVTPLALTLGLAAAPVARAHDTFAAAHDDAPAAQLEQGSSLVPLALAPDPYDDAGMSARSFQRSDDAQPVLAYALAPDPYDDAGMSARGFELGVGSGN